jgi:hypothetical protein
MNFDQWLEAELDASYRTSSESPVPQPRYVAPPPRRNLMLKALAALVGSKAALAGTAAVALAATGIGVKTVTTGDPNPVNWGSSVTTQVQHCKDARPSPDASPKPSPGSRGIGHCVSAFAKQHGQAERAEHSKSGSHPTPGAHPTGKPEDTPPEHPTPPAHPTPHAH